MPTHTASRLKRRAILTAIGGATIVSGTQAKAAILPAGIRTEKTDVVVIGAGTAGMVAALQAAQDGAKVVALEKTPEDSSGGDSRMSGGIFFVPGKADTPELRQSFVADNNRVTDDRGNKVLFRVIANRAWSDITWLQQQGCQFLDYDPAALGTGGTMTLAPAPWAGMPRFFDTMKKQFASRGGKLIYEAKAKQLILDNRGHVTGVKVATPDGIVDYHANAVVIAAGGFCANKLMLEEFIHPDADALLVRGSQVATGDGHMMALEAGAGLQNMVGLKTVSVVAVDPREPSGANPEKALRHCIAINRDGNRYVDESKGLLINGRAVLDQPGQVVALVFDETMKQDHEIQMSIATFKSRNLTILAADTIEDLAALIKVPPAQLKATVAAFNKSVADGKAPTATPPKAALAMKVDKPKFYAFYPLVPAITQTFGAIVTDDSARVLQPDGTVIPGLYAAGNCAGPLYYDSYWPGGMQIACLSMGRIAGNLAATAQG